MSDDLIRRSDAIDEIRKECQALHSLGFIPLATVGGMVDAINHAPTIEPKRGEWKPKNHHTDYCSNCGFEETQWRTADYNFCPSCGARMKGVDDEHTV